MEDSSEGEIMKPCGRCGERARARRVGRTVTYYCINCRDNYATANTAAEARKAWTKKQLLRKAE